MKHDTIKGRRHRNPLHAKVPGSARFSAVALAHLQDTIRKASAEQKLAEIQLQTIKHTDSLAGLSNTEICKVFGIGIGFVPEVKKMNTIAQRLVQAGLDPAKL